MRKIALVFFTISALFILSCASPTIEIVGPFTIYSHETFIKEDTGETGLFVDDEDWYTLINLSGFEDIDMKFSRPTQFLFQEKEDIIVSAFTEKIRGIKNSEMCMKAHSPDKYKQEINSKIVSAFSSGGRKYIYYHPFYDGYCFTFHFSMRDDQMSVNKVSRILDSIKFIDGKFTNVRIKKLLYTHDKRLQILIPESWKYSFKTRTDTMPSALVFSPEEGNSFRMLVTLYERYDGSPIQAEEVKKIIQDKMTKNVNRAVQDQVLHELKKNKAIVYYYDSTDMGYNPSDPEDYPFVIQGSMFVEDSGLYFTILYRENGLTAAQQGLDAMANVRILDLRNNIPKYLKE